MADAFDPVRTLADILTEHGPLTEDDVALRLGEMGTVDPEAVADHVLDEIDYPARQLVDDRWVWLPTLLAGRVFTHRLTTDEAAHDILTVSPDLDPITALCEHDEYQRLTDGSTVQLVVAGYDDELLEERGIPPELVDPLPALLLAPGTLGALGVAAGDLVGVRLTEPGLVLERVTAVAQSTAGEQLAATLDADAPVYFAGAVWTACVGDPELFTEPLPPLREILDDSGLAYHGDWLAPGGFDFGHWHFETSRAWLAERHGLDDNDAFALYTLIDLYHRIRPLVDTDDVDEPLHEALAAAGEEAPGPGEAEPGAERFIDLVGKVAGALADPELAKLLLAETIGSGSDGAAVLGMFAEMLEPKAPRAARVALRWLRAVALERIGAIDAAERELLAAESMDPEWPPVLIDLARIASDRGDTEGGLALLRRAGAEPDHPLVTLLERYRPAPRPDLGRNQPCWCGSGRKYKKCHLGHEQLALAERARWLYIKAAYHAQLSGWRELLDEVDYERFRYDDDDDLDVPGDPLVLDAVLFEGGAFADFLQIRGSLLPDDERLLAERWLLVDRSVFEVERVQPGRGVTLRDVRSGDTHEVSETTASRVLRPGQLICARVVPVGGGMQFFGGIEPVALHERDRLIDLLDTEPDPVTLVAFLSRRLAPPELTDTEGDPLAICEE